MTVKQVNKQLDPHKVTLNVKGEVVTYTKWAGTEHRALYGAVAEYLRNVGMDVSQVTMYLKRFKSRDNGYDYKIEKL